MILHLHDVLRRRIHAILTDLYGLHEDQLPPITIEHPPNRIMGDLAVTVAFELARTLRKAPRLIGQEIAGALGPIEGVAGAEAAPNGYVNIFLDRAGAIRRLMSDRDAEPAANGASPTAKTVVEHTAINPNKAAHIGHLRNAALGDTLVRLLRFRRQDVEVQNYIDDTGVQVADVVVGFRRLESKTFDDVRRIADETRFDYHCWDLYARVTEWYEAAPQRLEERKQTLRDLEHGTEPAASMAAFIAERIVQCHLATMDRLNVEYDLLSWEGDILRLDFWSRAFEILKHAGAIFLQETGPQSGCWVMTIDDGQATEEAAATADDARTKVIVRSDGTVTYVGKDIAYQLWKFGLLDRSFGFRPLDDQRTGRPLWSTTSSTPKPAPEADPSASPPVPAFGHATAVFNVIDTRQTYLQELLKQSLAALGHPREAEHSVHFSYEMVALSHATAATLGYEATEAAGRPFVEVSGRKGLGVKADDLIDQLIAAAAGEVETRQAELSASEVQEIASMIAVAAIRYFMIKYSRGKIIAFDIREALSFDGESGPYLQYAGVRAANILHKLKAQEGIDESELATRVGSLSEASLGDPDGTDLWALVLEAARLDEVAEQAIRTLELSILAKYAFGLAQRFNAFYHQYPVISETDPDTRIWRAAAVSFFRTQLTQALSLMGAEVPRRM